MLGIDAFLRSRHVAERGSTRIIGVSESVTVGEADRQKPPLCKPINTLLHRQHHWGGDHAFSYGCV